MHDDELRRRWSLSLGSAPRADLAIEDTYRSLAAPCPPQPKALRDALSLHEVIGRGGMGTVWRGTQHCLEREVAVKSLSSEQDGSTASGRDAFLAEALLSGRLQHPNIVPVHELRQRGGSCFLLMRRVEGETWAQQLREERRPLQEHLEILVQICNPVAYAHSRGVLHLDIKPSNVMLGSFGEIFLMDWGLAACTSESALGAGLRAASAIRTPCGTPCYLPPELARGDGSALGPWSDVYLLGAVLYQLLTGRPPRAGRDFLQVIRAAAAGTLPPIDRALPAELRALLQCSLAEDPRQRPSARELQRRLREHLHHRESLHIALQSAQTLEGCLAAGPTQAAGEVYEGLAAAVAGFQQARSLWPANLDAQTGEQRARQAFVEWALRQGDLGLAETQLQRLPASADRQALSVRLREVRQTAAGRAQRTRRLRWAGACLLLGLALLLTMGLLRARAEVGELTRQRQATELHAQSQAERLRWAAEQAESRRRQGAQDLLEQQAETRRLRRELAALSPEVAWVAEEPPNVADEPAPAKPRPQPPDFLAQARDHLENARFDLAVRDFRRALAGRPEQDPADYLAAARAAALAAQFPAAEPDLRQQALDWLDAFTQRVRLECAALRVQLEAEDDAAARAFLVQLGQGWRFVRDEDPAFIQLHTHPQFRQLLEGDP